MAEAEQRHMLVVPWSGEGHANVMFRFALLVAAQQNILVSFAFPARAYASASKRGKIGSSLPPSLRVYVVNDGLPCSKHKAIKPPLLIFSSAVIVKSVEALFHQGVRAGSLPSPSASHGTDGSLVSSTWPPVCCIISDTFLPAMHALAESLGVPRVEFWTGSATVYNIFLHVPQLLAKGVLPLCKVAGEDWNADALIDFIPGLPPFPVTQLPWDLLQKQDVSQPMVEFFIKAFEPSKAADRIVVHSVLTLEKHVYDAMQAEGFPIYPIGPILEGDMGLEMTRHECLHWLDAQKPASVVYVAFGTMLGLSPPEIQSIAQGIEDSKCAFLWVAPEVDHQERWDASTDWQDFIKRTVAQEKGLIVPWAPQMQVLNHSAVGAFISHCGWNSVLESLWEGVPLVACSRVAEQNCNENCVVEDWKTGIRMERTTDGSFTSDMVRKAIEKILGNQEVKTRALHLKQVVRNAADIHGTSHSNLVNLVDHISRLLSPQKRNRN